MPSRSCQDTRPKQMVQSEGRGTNQISILVLWHRSLRWRNANYHPFPPPVAELSLSSFRWRNKGRRTAISGSWPDGSDLQRPSRESVQKGQLPRASSASRPCSVEAPGKGQEWFWAASLLGSLFLEKITSGVRRRLRDYRSARCSTRDSSTTTAPIEIRAHANVSCFGSGVCERSGLIVIVLVLHWRQHVHEESVLNTAGPKAWLGMINRAPYRRFDLLPGGKGSTVRV